MRDARAAGLPVGVLTNDLRAFRSQEWVNGLGLEEVADVIADGSVEGILKPDPRIYRLAAGRARPRAHRREPLHPSETRSTRIKSSSPKAHRAWLLPY